MEEKGEKSQLYWATYFSNLCFIEKKSISDKLIFDQKVNGELISHFRIIKKGLNPKGLAHL